MSRLRYKRQAVASIHGRFSRLFDDALPQAIRVRHLSMDQLRGVGLSCHLSSCRSAASWCFRWAEDALLPA